MTSDAQLSVDHQAETITRASPVWLWRHRRHRHQLSQQARRQQSAVEKPDQELTEVGRCRPGGSRWAGPAGVIPGRGQPGADLRIARSGQPRQLEDLAVQQGAEIHSGNLLKDCANDPVTGIRITKPALWRSLR